MALSPPASSDGDLVQHGLHHLVQHNSNTSYPQEQRYDDDSHVHSNYSSPAPTHNESYVYRGQGQARLQYQYPDAGMGLQYDPYSSGQVYQDSYSTPATSPPTPSMNDTLRTRSSTGVSRPHQNMRPMPEGRPRAEKSPKPKRTPKKTKVKAERRTAKMEVPLSELTKDWTHIPVVDIDAYVNRSADVRRREVADGKMPGKVKRPMNSFMLYRKAYQNRTKEYCEKTNHQVVSQVCGESWPLEADEIKDQFTEWARVERINHQNAHPGYKFSPTKPGTAKASKRKMSEELMSEESDLEDYEWGGPSKRAKKHHRPTPPRFDQPVAYPTTRSAYQYSRENSADPNQGRHNRSSYQATNPGRPLPAPYNLADLTAGEYYQQTIQPHAYLEGVEDILIKRTVAPGGSAHSYLGLPGRQEYDMMNQYPMTPGHQDGQLRIDPALTGLEQSCFDGGIYADHHLPQNSHYVESQNDDQQWQAQWTMDNQHDPLLGFLDPELSQDGLQITNPHMDILKGNQEGWHIGSLDGGSGDFDDKWMDGDGL